MSEVRALHRGYFGGLVRERGDVFEVPDGMKASWWEDAKANPSAMASSAASIAERPAKAKPGPKAKGETIAAPTAAPFSDPPEPVRVENEINTATGGTQPDWLSPNADI